MKEKGKMEIHNHVINPRSCEDRYLLLANNIAIQGHPAVGLELDLAELEDQLTHQVYKSDPEIALVFVDIFKMDPNFLENENNMPINFCQCQVGHKLLKIKLEPGQEEHHGKHHSYCFSSKFNPSQQSDSTRKGEPSMTKSTSVTVKRSESSQITNELETVDKDTEPNKSLWHRIRQPIINR
ncbi:hypothetical protein L2E82_01254 [Cichorium intybus]|uniref:Uncharacterized protein n=1 Tax=Cichorium intybus TaxID=13427 RepID=A0ACB9GZM6_CICIN|nr:hypothetical protein L2E82_01254 [Cichorium intybus]